MYSRVPAIFSLLLLGCLSLTSVNAHAIPQVNANSLVSGILSYTHWHAQIEHLNFCIVDGPTKFINTQFFNLPSPLIRPNQIKVIELKSAEVIQNPLMLHHAECNILYFAHTTDKAQQQVIQHTNYPALSISEQNSDCAIGSAFCLYRMAYRYNFKVNLNSLKKSNIRVNSKVLMLADLEGQSK